MWRDAAGLGWTNPYDRRVWKYNVDVADRRRAGRVRRDHVRLRALPLRRRRGRRRLRATGGRSKKREAIPAFLRYAKRRLEPFGVRISAAVFGLSAARDLGIGQLPRQMAPHLDTVYAMTYPSLFGAGELGLDDPSPRRVRPWRARCAASSWRSAAATRSCVPWVQDFSFSVPYDLDEVRAQIDAARLSGAKGYMLWNAEGLYTDGALAPPS